MQVLQIASVANAKGAKLAARKNKGTNKQTKKYRHFLSCLSQLKIISECGFIDRLLPKPRPLHLDLGTSRSIMFLCRTVNLKEEQ